jgi:alpha-ketoglutarate-dependent taurine dioxygenase
MLSPHMQRYLESLTALHSADLQAQGTRDLGRTVRREPVTTEHPLIRTHPVTGWKSIFFNPGFVTKIVGVPKTESDHIISLLNEIVATSPEIHARFRWEEGDVAFWDNRVTVSYRRTASGLKSIVLTYSRIILLRMASRRIGDTQCVLLSGLRSRIWIHRAGARKTI